MEYSNSTKEFIDRQITQSELKQQRIDQIEKNINHFMPTDFPLKVGDTVVFNQVVWQIVSKKDNIVEFKAIKQVKSVSKMTRNQRKKHRKRLN